jgi:hypothetical protein
MGREIPKHGSGGGNGMMLDPDSEEGLKLREKVKSLSTGVPLLCGWPRDDSRVATAAWFQGMMELPSLKTPKLRRTCACDSSART